MVWLALFVLVPMVSFLPINFNYEDFNNLSETELTATGRAKIAQGMLVLSDNNFSSYGRVMRREVINFCGDTPLSFTTDFTFTIESRDKKQNADGLAFLISPNIQALSNQSYGRWLALVEPEKNGLATNYLVAVEFDTFPNRPPDYPEFQDIDDNHVGININQVISANSTSLWPHGIKLGTGNLIAARVVYNASLQLLSVYVSSDVNFTNIGNPLLEHNINLCDYVGSESYIGFSAGTGTGNVDFHNIHSWGFTSSFTVLPKTSSSLPDRGQRGDSYKIAFIIVASCAIFPLLLAILVYIRTWNRMKRMNKDTKDDKVYRAPKNSLVLFPHEMRYGDIFRATQGFSAQNILGQGGFGSVYRGFLPDDQSLVAVKRISENSGQGEREFLAEVKIISKLSHRNLVKLRGWCMRDKELVLVYEYMPQGSVDQALFKNDSVLLLWHTRYKIISGLASALIYLHEEWEQQVLHRDIKCSNIMLDAEYNARLGDFGLARVVEHNGKSRITTSNVAGTLGYIAPEISYSFKFTQAADVYSFGVVVLEIISGRKVVSFDEDGTTLLPWVEERYAAGTLLSVVDARLHGVFDPDEATRLLKTALTCVDSNPVRRPSMRQAFHSLSGDEEGT